MGPLIYILGIEIVPIGANIILSQQKYIRELLATSGLSMAKSVPSLMTTITTLHVGDSPPFNNPVRYRQVVGALQYVTL